MRMRKMVSSLLAVLLFAGILPAQNNWFLEGKIIAEDAQAVLMANVVAKSRSDSSIVSFSFSNEAGEYRIEIPGAIDSCLLQISALGYQERWLVITQGSTQTNPVLNIILQTQILNMQTVVIKSEGLAIRQKNDTTEFRAASFADGSERKIGELLKKLPGVAVAEDGSVFVNGRRVKKIMVDGDEVWKGQSDLITKHLPANIVDKIQTIDNYQENAVLKDFEDSGEIALNLSIKEDFKFKNNLDLEALLGTNDRREIGVHDLALVKTLKIAFIAGVNNTGKMYQNAANNLHAAASAEETDPVDGGGIPRVINYEVVPSFQITPDRYIDNHSKLGALSIIKPVSREFKIQNHLSISQDRVNLQQYNETTYLLGSDTISIQDDLKSNSSLLKWKDQFSAQFTRGEHSSMEYNAQISGVVEQVGNELLSSQNGRFRGMYAQNKNRFQQHLKSNIKLNAQQVLQLDGAHQVSKSPEFLQLSYPALQLPASTNTHHQEANLGWSKLEFTAKHLIKVSNFFKIKNLLGYAKGQDQLTSQLISTQEVQVPNHTDLLSNNLILNKMSSFAASGFSLQVQRLKISSELKILHQSVNVVNQHQEAYYNQKQLRFNPAIGFGLALKGVRKIYGTYFKGNTPVSIGDVANGYILQGYRDFQQSQTGQLINNHQTFVLGYFDFNLYNQSALSFSLFRNVANNAYGRFLQITPGYTFLTRVPAGKYKLLSVNFSKDQLISSLSSKIKFTTALSVSSYPGGINEQRFTTEARTISGSVVAQSALSGPLSAELELKIGGSRIISGLTRTKSVFSQYILSLNYRFQPWLRGNLHLDVFQKDLLDPNSKELKLLDVRLIVSPQNKPFYLEFISNNLLGAKWFEVISAGDAYTYYSGLRLNPTQVMLKIGYSL